MHRLKDIKPDPQERAIAEIKERLDEEIEFRKQDRLQIVKLGYTVKELEEKLNVAFSGI